MTTLQLAVLAFACLGIMLVLTWRHIRRSSEAAVRRSTIASVGPARGPPDILFPGDDP
jgi:hypothetical protein